MGLRWVKQRNGKWTQEHVDEPRRDGAESDDGAYVGEAVVVGETPMALRVRIGGARDARWIPKSCVHDDSEVFDNDDNARGRLVLKRWFAEKEGLLP